MPIDEKRFSIEESIYRFDDMYWYTRLPFKRQRCNQNIRQPNKLNYLKYQRTDVQTKAIAVLNDVFFIS